MIRMRKKKLIQIVALITSWIFLCQNISFAGVSHPETAFCLKQPTTFCPDEIVEALGDRPLAYSSVAILCEIVKTQHDKGVPQAQALEQLSAYVGENADKLQGIEIVPGEGYCFKVTLHPDLGGGVYLIGYDADGKHIFRPVQAYAEEDTGHAEASGSQRGYETGGEKANLRFRETDEPVEQEIVAEIHRKLDAVLAVDLDFMYLRSSVGLMWDILVSRDRGENAVYADYYADGASLDVVWGEGMNVTAVSVTDPLNNNADITRQRIIVNKHLKDVLDELSGIAGGEHIPTNTVDSVLSYFDDMRTSGYEETREIYDWFSTDLIEAASDPEILKAAASLFIEHEIIHELVELKLHQMRLIMQARGEAVLPEVNSEMVATLIARKALKQFILDYAATHKIKATHLEAAMLLVEELVNRKDRDSQDGTYSLAMRFFLKRDMLSFDRPYLGHVRDFHREHLRYEEKPNYYAIGRYLAFLGMREEKQSAFGLNPRFVADPQVVTAQVAQARAMLKASQAQLPDTGIVSASDRTTQPAEKGPGGEAAKAEEAVRNLIQNIETLSADIGDAGIPQIRALLTLISRVLQDLRGIKIEGLNRWSGEAFLSCMSTLTVGFNAARGILVRRGGEHTLPLISRIDSMSRDITSLQDSVTHLPAFGLVSEAVTHKLMASRDMTEEELQSKEAMLYASIKEELLKRNHREDIVRDVINAMMENRRHNFIPPGLIASAYESSPLPGQAISSPIMVAEMTALLIENIPDYRNAVILEIGTGSGWQAAILGSLVKEVYTVETLERLAKDAHKNITRAGRNNVHVIVGDGSAPLFREEMSFDGIMVTAGAPRLPAALRDELKDGGAIVIPITGKTGRGTLNLIQKRAKEDESGEETVMLAREIMEYSFVPLLGMEGQATGPADTAGGYILKGEIALEELQSIIENGDIEPFNFRHTNIPLNNLRRFIRARLKGLLSEDEINGIMMTLIPKNMYEFGSVIITSRDIPPEEDNFVLGFNSHAPLLRNISMNGERLGGQRVMLGYAADFVRYLSHVESYSSGETKTSLVAEYLLHEALESFYDHEACREIQKKAFPENYQGPYENEGLLRECIRSYINQQLGLAERRANLKLSAHEGKLTRGEFSVFEETTGGEVGFPERFDYEAYAAELERFVYLQIINPWQASSILRTMADYSGPEPGRYAQELVENAARTRGRGKLDREWEEFTQRHGNRLPPLLLPGQKIWHLHYGEGRIISVEGKGEERVLTINFGAGEKKLILAHARNYIQGLRQNSFATQDLSQAINERRAKARVYSLDELMQAMEHGERVIVPDGREVFNTRWGQIDLKNLNNLELYTGRQSGFYLARDIELAVERGYIRLGRAQILASPKICERLSREVRSRLGIQIQQVGWIKFWDLKDMLEAAPASYRGVAGMIEVAKTVHVSNLADMYRIFGEPEFISEYGWHDIRCTVERLDRLEALLAQVPANFTGRQGQLEMTRRLDINKPGELYALVPYLEAKYNLTLGWIDTEFTTSQMEAVTAAPDMTLYMDAVTVPTVATAPTVQSILSAPEEERLVLAQALLSSRKKLFANSDQFTIEQLATLDDGVVITGNNLKPQGELGIGGVDVFRFGNYPGHKVQFEVLQGHPYRVWIFDDSDKLVEFIQLGTIYRPDGTLVKTFHGKIEKPEFAKLNNVEIRDHYVKEDGTLTIGGRNVKMGEGYKYHQAVIEVREGQIWEVTLVNEETGERTPRPFCLVYDKKSGKLVDSFLRNLSSTRFKEYDGVTIRGLRLDKFGNLAVGAKKKPIPHFSKHKSKKVELDVIQGQYDRVRIYDEEDNLLEDHEFALMYDEKGELFNSFWDTLAEGTYLSLKNVTIKRFKLNKAGVINLGGPAGQGAVVFSQYPIDKYPDHRGALTVVENGIVSRATLLDGAGNIVEGQDRRYSLVYDPEGNLKASFFRVDTIDDLKEFGTCTIKHFWLNDVSGGLHLGKHWAAFTNYKGHEVEIDLIDGVVTQVRILGAGREVLDTCNFALIYNAEGQLVDSFWEMLSPEKLAELKDHIIKRVRLGAMATKDIGGKVGPGGKTSRIKVPGHANEEIIIIVKNGEVSEVQDKAGNHLDATITAAIEGEAEVPEGAPEVTIEGIYAVQSTIGVGLDGVKYEEAFADPANKEDSDAQLVKLREEIEEKVSAREERIVTGDEAVSEVEWLLGRLCEITNCSDPLFRANMSPHMQALPDVVRRLAAEPSPELLIASMLHDADRFFDGYYVAIKDEPPVDSPRHQNYYKPIQHPRMAADFARSLLELLGIDPRLIANVDLLIRNHEKGIRKDTMPEPLPAQEATLAHLIEDSAVLRDADAMSFFTPVLFTNDLMDLRSKGREEEFSAEVHEKYNRVSDEARRIIDGLMEERHDEYLALEGGQDAYAIFAEVQSKFMQAKGPEGSPAEALRDLFGSRDTLRDKPITITSAINGTADVPKWRSENSKTGKPYARSTISNELRALERLGILQLIEPPRPGKSTQYRLSPLFFQIQDAETLNRICNIQIDNDRLLQHWSYDRAKLGKAADEIRKILGAAKTAPSILAPGIFDLDLELEGLIVAEPGRQKLAEIETTINALLTQIQGLIESGEIHPEISFDPDTNVISGALPDRPLRVGFYPIAGDPPHWGHLAVMLQSIVDLKLDKLIIISRGAPTYKSGLSSESVRFGLIEAMTSRLAPIVQFSPIGSKRDDTSVQYIPEILDVNPDIGVNAYYIGGDEYGDELWRRFEPLVTEQRLSPSHSIGVALISRQNHREELQKRLESVESVIPLATIQNPIDGLSSAALKEDMQQPGIPYFIRLLIQQYGFYGVAASGLPNICEAAFKVMESRRRVIKAERDAETGVSVEGRAGVESSAVTPTLEAKEVMDIFNAFENTYEASPQNCTCQTIEFGLINRTYRLVIKEEGIEYQYFVQKINSVFNVEAMDHNLQLLERLQNETVLPEDWDRLDFLNVKSACRSGVLTKLYRDADGAVWRVSKGIPGEIETYLTLEDIPERDLLTAIYNIGRSIAVIDNMYNSIESDQWMTPLPNMTSLKYHWSYLNSVLSGERVTLSLSQDSSRKVELQRDRMSGYEKRVSPLLDDLNARRYLPDNEVNIGTGIYNNDVRPKNAIFKRKPDTGELYVASWLDPDSTQPARLFNDLAIAIRTTTYMVVMNYGDINDDPQLLMSIVDYLADCIIDGYIELGQTNRIDRGLMKWYAYRYILEYYHTWCDRFLADFLVGDKYFELDPREPNDTNLTRAEMGMEFLKRFERILASQGIEVNDTSAFSALATQAESSRVAYEFPAPAAVNTVFFDAGNILLKVDYHRATRALAQYSDKTEDFIYQKILSDEILVPFESGQVTPEAYFQNLKKIFNLNMTFEEFMPIFSDIYEANQPVADMMAALKERGYKIFIITNTNPIHRDYMPSKYKDIFGIADGVIASCDVGCMKTDKRIFETALERAGVSADRAVFIDDVEDYVTTARSAGISGIQYHYRDGPVLYDALCRAFEGQSLAAEARSFVSSLRGLAKPAQEDGEEILVGIDTTIGNLGSYAPNLLKVLAELKDQEGLSNLVVIASDGTELSARVNSYIRDAEKAGKKVRVVSVVKESNRGKHMFDSLAGKAQIVSVDDSQVIEGESLNQYIPVTRIIELALKRLLNKPHEPIPYVAESEENGILKLILSVQEGAKPLTSDELRQRYDEEAEFIGKA